MRASTAGDARLDVRDHLVEMRLLGTEDELDRLQAILHGRVVALDERAVVDELSRCMIDLASDRRERCVELLRGRAEQLAERRETRCADRARLVPAHRIGRVLGFDLRETQLRRQRALGAELAREQTANPIATIAMTQPSHIMYSVLHARDQPACVIHASPIWNSAYATTRITPSRRDSSPSLFIIG